MRFLALSVLVLLASPAWSDEEAPFILKRCEAQVGASGAPVVKGCVDRDSAALAALKSYPAAERPVIARCEYLSDYHAWADVKACADRDIEAARLLASHADRDKVGRCQREMGRFGALMVKSCVDQDLQLRR